MYGTICAGWKLWQLHSSVDDDDPDQSEDAVRELVQNTDGVAFPVTGYFFVEREEFEEAARRAQELENSGNDGISNGGRGSGYNGDYQPLVQQPPPMLSYEFEYEYQ